MLQVKNLSYAVRTGLGRRTDFRISDVNFELEQGYLMCLLGENGSGKSTLLRLLYGLKKPDAGTITWKGREFGGTREAEKADFRGEIAYVGEEDLFFCHNSIGENIDYFSDFYPGFSRKNFNGMLEDFGVDVKILEKSLREVSTGERKQVQLAFAMARRPGLLLLDEPGANLDPVFRVSLMDMLQRQIAKEEISVIISTHILEDVEDVADYIGIMSGGNMKFFGDREKLAGQMGGSVLWM